jgi:hypothetical protein
MAGTMKITVVRDVMQCSPINRLMCQKNLLSPISKAVSTSDILVHIYQRNIPEHSSDAGCRFLCFICMHQPHYMVQHPRRQQFKLNPLSSHVS